MSSRSATRLFQGCSARRANVLSTLSSKENSLGNPSNGTLSRLVLHSTCLKRLFSGTAPKSSSDKIYELRTYAVHPKDVKSFLELSKEWMHLRTSHSKLVGYWTGELGAGINDMVHIWEYESLEQRAGVRKSLAGDPEWISKYFSKILPWLDKQENSVLRCFPGTDVIYPESTGAYELQFIYTAVDPAQTATHLKNLKRSDATLLGSWYNALSQPCFGWLLWHSKAIDNLVSTPVVIPAESGIKIVASKVMLPTSWSTMK